MTTIPNELKIIINTSIPGFKKITYTPSMTIPNISKDEKSIQFNPLVKLNQSVVDKIPENLRKKEFFNKSLFQSLINYINAAPVSLSYATNNGYVDNNIKVTLNAIFPEKSVIYINKNPYTIVDVQWSKGDWKLDTKHKPQELDISKITDPNLYANLIKQQILIGEKQLENLPSSVVYGPSFNGSKNALGSSIRQPPVQPPPSLPLPNASTVLPRPDSKLLPAPPERLAIDALPSSDTSTPILSSSNTTTVLSGPHIKPPKLLPAPPKRLAIEAPPSIDTSTPTVASVVDMTDVVVPASPPINLIFSSVSTSHLRNYLNNQQFYFCINAIFQKLSTRQKEIINNNLLHTSKININENGINLSKLAYSNSVKSIAVNKTPPNGNCFFSSTADALNYHNYTNETDKIIHGIYGIGDKIFTQSYLRSLVVKYYFSPLNVDLIESFHQFALVNVNELNETFENQVKTIKSESGPEFVLSTEQYIEIANDVRNNSDNFLVNVVREVPIEDANYFKPFSEINNADEIKDYLMSKTYWANEIAIYALCSEIGINVIPIHKVEKHADKYMLKIPFGNFSKNRNNNWSRYLFLYWSEGHYELLSFNFIERKLVKKFSTPQVISYNTTKKTIFKRNDLTSITPLCILFLIFGEYYYSQTDEVKSNFSFFPQIMQLFEDNFNEALRDASVKDELSAAFKTFFENAEKMTLTGLPSSGGANGPYYNQPYNQPYNQRYGQPYNQRYDQHYGQPYSPRYNQHYGQPYSRYYNQYYNPQVQNLVKKEEKVDNINISYYISIDMELYPGKSIPPEELPNLRCTQKWNAVRKAYSDFTGKPYVIPPVYRIDKVNSNELQKKQNINANNRTRKYYQNPYQKNKRNVTKKYYNRY